MDVNLEIKKVKAEIARVYARRLEMDVKKDDLMAEIKRLDEHMAVQEKTENDLLEKIEKFKNQ